jgi:hypothetical protein
MKKKLVFWISVAVLAVGIIVFCYGYITLQNLYATYTISSDFFYLPEVKQQWDLAQLLQRIGLGVLVLDAIILAYCILVKK